MHLMGSHSDFCTRLDKDARRFQYQTEKISCYVSTIAQTDKFLEDTVKILNENKESWSLVYFSDHGLMHVGKGGERTLTHGEWKRQSYGVPLVKISSDDTRREMIKVRRSAFNFYADSAVGRVSKPTSCPMTAMIFGGMSPMCRAKAITLPLSTDSPTTPRRGMREKANRLKIRLKNDTYRKNAE